MNEQSIMCAVDLSWRSDWAFNYAVALAESRRAPLDVLVAISARRPFSWRARERVAQLAELRRRASAAGIQMKVTVQHGKPADVILQHATSSALSPRFIVLGAPSRRGLDRFLLASVAQTVVHQADRPTLIVPASQSVASCVNVPFRRVLCAIDFSPTSMSALDEAFRLLRHGGGTMRLLHVVDIAQPAVPRLTSEFPAIDYTEQLTMHAWGELRRLLPVSQELCGRVQIQVAVGFVLDQIVRNAKEMKADLVVLGVRKRGALGRLLGSTTGRALRHVSCPVLAVPAHQNQERAGAHLDAIAA